MRNDVRSRPENAFAILNSFEEVTDLGPAAYRLIDEMRDCLARPQDSEARTRFELDLEALVFGMSEDLADDPGDDVVFGFMRTLFQRLAEAEVTR